MGWWRNGWLWDGETPGAIKSGIYPVNAPTFDYSATTYDKELRDDAKIILKVLFSSLTSGATAYALDMNPLFYAAIGGVLSESRIKLNLNHLSSIGGATGVTYYVIFLKVE